jgi:hypothetical protein
MLVFYKAKVGENNGDIENRKWVSSMLYTMVSPSGTVVTKKDLRRSKISRTLPAQIMPSNNDSAWVK